MDNLDELYQNFLLEKKEFEHYRKEKENELLLQEKVLENDRSLFDKRLKILQSAYQQLAIDREKVEREKRTYHMNESYDRESTVIQYVSIHSFFKGVNSMLALKKRYKDLLKIFHPDNLCGDKDTVQMINKEYRVLKEKYYES
ncbi:MAG: hypothetical protein PHE02_12585 [Lachnospiraceae bacterium]|nr:hypothetical protein [Lachnospiraceae bacterium]